MTAPARPVAAVRMGGANREMRQPPKRRRKRPPPGGSPTDDLGGSGQVVGSIVLTGRLTAERSQRRRCDFIGRWQRDASRTISTDDDLSSGVPALPFTPSGA